MATVTIKVLNEDPNALIVSANGAIIDGVRRYDYIDVDSNPQHVSYVAYSGEKWIVYDSRGDFDSENNVSYQALPNV